VAGAADPGCLFCRIVAGEVDATVVTTTDHSVAFLDHRPLFEGHTLVVPRAHVATLRDLPVAEVGPYFADVQRLAVAVQDGMGADGSFVAANNVISQSVPHLHFHVVPRRPKDGLRGFFWPRTKYADAAEAADYAARLRDALASG
jgi:histidine triad (HIT) family protein